MFNQPQHDPIPVEIQIAVLWMIQNGHMDVVPVNRIKDFQSRFAEFLQTADREGDYEHGEAAREPERDREEGEEPERCEDEGLAPMFIGEMGNRNDADAGHDDFDARQDADLFCVHSHVIHRVNDDPGERDPLAEANENIAEQKMAERGIECPEAAPEIPTLGSRNGARSIFAHLALNEKGPG